MGSLDAQIASWDRSDRRQRANRAYTRVDRGHRTRRQRQTGLASVVPSARRYRPVDDSLLSRTSRDARCTPTSVALRESRRRHQ